MKGTTLSSLNDYYSHLFNVEPTALWRRVTVGPHGENLKDYEGYYVVWRADAVHVSTPQPGVSMGHTLSTTTVKTMQNPAFWQEFAWSQGLQVFGPATHAYLDDDPGPVDGVTRLSEADLASFPQLTDEADWAESGWNDRPPHMFGLYEHDSLVAAANLNPFHGEPRDVGVIVASGSRGRGLSHLVGQHAASFAVQTHGFARWGSRDANVASSAASRRLGFEPWCSQLAVR